MEFAFKMEADNDGNIHVHQSAIMTPEEFLRYAEQVYRFARNMSANPHSEHKLLPSDEP